MSGCGICGFGSDSVCAPTGLVGFRSWGVIRYGAISLWGTRGRWVVVVVECWVLARWVRVRWNHILRREVVVVAEAAGDAFDLLGVHVLRNWSK